MYQSLEPVKLRSGETVEAGFFRAPNLDWAERIEALLLHQDEIWNWQNRVHLRETIDLDVTYYVLHRDGVPLSSIATWKSSNVAMRGHVWTVPAERRNGACKGLMARQMDDFRTHGGEAVYLFTNFETVPYRINVDFDFEAVEPGSGHMVYLTRAKEDFEEAFFVGGETDIRPLSWSLWPRSAPLFSGPYPGAVRCAGWKLIGQLSPELPYLEALRAELSREGNGAPPRALQLVDTATDAVAGMAAWTWADSAETLCQVDIYCHPKYWDYADRLLEALELPKAKKYIVHGDGACPKQLEVLSRAGFRQVKDIASVPVEPCRSEWGYTPRSALGATAVRAAMAVLGPAFPKKINGTGRQRFDLRVFERA